MIRLIPTLPQPPTAIVSTYSNRTSMNPLFLYRKNSVCPISNLAFDTTSSMIVSNPRFHNGRFVDKVHSSSITLLNHFLRASSTSLLNRGTINQSSSFFVLVLPLPFVAAAHPLSLASRTSSLLRFAFVSIQLLSGLSPLQPASLPTI